MRGSMRSTLRRSESRGWPCYDPIVTTNWPRIPPVTVPAIHPDPHEVPWAVTPEKIQAAVVRIVEISQPRKVILFGSAARGRTHRDSDADLMVVVWDDAVDSPRSESVRIRSELKDVFMPMDILVVTESALAKYGQTYGLIYREALETGLVLYELEA